VLDKGSVEYIGPYGLEKGLLNISNNIAKLSTGVITSYALYILIGLILYLLFYSFIDNSIIILVLVISLSLVPFMSSAYSNTAYQSAFRATLLQSSTQ
jgi:NADH-ubiquinone oxidoreductase chain 5